MKLLIASVFQSFQRFIRRLYWLFRLMQSDITHPLNVHHPVICEGSGKRIIGPHAQIQKGAEISVGKNGSLSIGARLRLGKSATFRLGNDAQVSVGEDFKMEYGSRMFITTDWTIGDDVQIATHCAIFSREGGVAGNVQIGNGTHIGDHSIIDCAANLTIGKDVAIGPNCVLYTHDHDYSSESAAAWKGPLICKDIVIDDGAWVGSGVTILPGVTIGKRAVIAAGAVVTKNVPAHSIWGGIPAKQIGETGKA